jgi:xanthine dehydrogenase YagS FAD-binding subunit
VTIVGADGTRTIPLEKFFTLPKNSDVTRENILKDGEILTEVRVPASAFAARSTYLKFKERDSLDFAMASVAAAVDLADDKTVRAARLVMGGVAPIPWRAHKAEESLVGKPRDAAALAAAADLALEGAKPLAKNGYKIPLAKALIRRALTQVNAMTV